MDLPLQMPQGMKLAGSLWVVVGSALLAAAGVTLADGSRDPSASQSWQWRIGAAGDLPPRDTWPKLDARMRATGRKIFEARCTSCHGKRGDGQGPWAFGMIPKPTDFTKGVYKLRSTPSGYLPTDADLFLSLTRGLHGTEMLPWPSLNERQRWALVAHLKSLSPRFRREPPGKPIAVPQPPVESGALLARGERLYRELGCVACHGEAGLADGEVRALVEGWRQERARIRDYTRGRFIRGSEMTDLFLTLRVGVEGTPMVAYPQLSNDDVWALAAYVRLLIRDVPLGDFPPAATVERGAMLTSPGKRERRP